MRIAESFSRDYLYIVDSGGCMIKNFGKINLERVIINDDICTITKGYEFLAQRKLRRNGGV